MLLEAFSILNMRCVRKGPGLGLLSQTFCSSKPHYQISRSVWARRSTSKIDRSEPIPFFVIGGYSFLLTFKPPACTFSGHGPQMAANRTAPLNFVCCPHTGCLCQHTGNFSRGPNIEQLILAALPAHNDGRDLIPFRPRAEYNHITVASERGQMEPLLPAELFAPYCLCPQQWLELGSLQLSSN